MPGSTKSKGKRKEPMLVDGEYINDQMDVDDEGVVLQISDAITPDESMLTPVTASRLAAAPVAGSAAHTCRVPPSSSDQTSR